MNRLTELWRRLLYLGRRESVEQILDQEVQFHVETRADELEQSGMTRDEATARARREFGPSARMREQSRAAWQIHWLEDLMSDLRYALRALRRSPGFGLAAIFSLALGIGANTTIFSLTMEFLFSVPSVSQPERLAAIRIGGNSHSPLPIYRMVRDAHIFDGLAGSYEEAEVNWRTGDDSYRLSAYRVTDNFFDVVGVPVAIGRRIQPGDRNVVVLAHSFWQNRLAGDPNILDRTLIFDGQPYKVIGVLPRDHRTILGFGFAPPIYLPVNNDDNSIVAFIARLPEGMTRQAAFARLKATCQEVDRVFPGREPRWADDIEVVAVTGLDRLKSLNMIPFTAFFGLLMVVVGLVLVIACANVASLLLARASARKQELGIRLAVGAGRGRLVRQLLAESLLLATLGTLAGLALNLWLTGIMNRMALPLPIPLQLHIAPDWRLLAYSTAIALASALFCGLLPALKATRADVHSALKREQLQVMRRRWNVRSLLVVGQLAVSVLLLAAGFLFLRNLMRATSMSPGFDVDHTVWASMRLVPQKQPKPQKSQALVNSALDALRALPGVEVASVARIVPLNGQQTNGSSIQTDLGKQFHVMYKNNGVGPDYFRVMAIPIVEGREFLPSDRAGAPSVAIINENFARQVFEGTSPINHTIRFPPGQPVTIVGVAKNSKYFTLGEENTLAMYSPFAQQEEPEAINFLVRAFGPPSRLVRPIARALGEIDRSAAVETKPMSDALVLALLPSRAGGAILGSIGVLGLALASIGLYGVLAYTIARRIREIGLRVALGAAPRNVLWMVLRDSFWLVAAGMFIGLGIAIVAMRPLAMFLVPGLSPTDPIAFLSVIFFLAAVAVAATIGPAHRALRVDPMVALRYE